MDRYIENMIEFLEDNKIATVTFSQGRYKSRIRKLSEDYPKECKILAENPDGSLCAHIPVEWIKIAPAAYRTEKQKQQSRLNIRKSPRAGHETE